MPPFTLPFNLFLARPYADIVSLSRCVAGFAGARCEEAVVVQTIQAPIWPTAGTVTSGRSF